MLARIKFQIEDLVNEILDRLPQDVFKSSTTTFLDPAMAGGQFVVEIVRRLRDNGHSDENIASRVFGLAEDQIDLNYAKRKKKLIGQCQVGSISTLETWVNNEKKFDVIVGNPPYDKHDNEPMYYKFLRLTKRLDPDHWALIVPNGWLIGTRSETMRRELFNHSGVREVIFKGSGAFNGAVTQNTVVVVAQRGYIGDVVFCRSQASRLYNATFTRDEAIHQLPQLLGDEGKAIWELAHRFPTKFAMNRSLNSPWGVAVSDGNGFGAYDETILSACAAAQRAVMPVYVVNATRKNCNHHPVRTEQEAINVAAWMKSKLFGLLFMWVRTTHRTVGTNMGQMPVVVVNGTYTDQQAYEMLGLTQSQIDWVNAL